MQKRQTADSLQFELKSKNFCSKRVACGFVTFEFLVGIGCVKLRLGRVRRGSHDAPRDSRG